MGYQPILFSDYASNVAAEHIFKIRVTFGSSVIASYRSKDATIARNSAGNYTVTLPKPYTEVTDFNVSFMDASGAVLFGVITSSTITTDGKLIIEIRTEAGTATDPTSGDVAYITIGVSSDVINSQSAVTV